MPIVRVALDVPLSSLFDYLAERELPVGQRVLVPFGRQRLVGVVMACPVESDYADDKLKPVLRVLDDTPPLPGEILDLLKFCSDYYRFPIGQTVMNALPTRLRDAEPLELRRELPFQLSASGLALDLAAFPKQRRAQLRLLETLHQRPCHLAELRTLANASALNAIREAGWIAEAQPDAIPLRFDGLHTLNAGQQQAVDAVTRSRGYAAFLLHGITGSGKTEVYLHLIRHALEQGGQVLLLIPEINLTPQLEQYFRARFSGAELVSLHSGLADGERARNWLRAQSGEARIVLGTRLAVFTPLPRLALVLVDEEHDPSFKQQDGLRYSARDLAVLRASTRRVPIVLGSATPSLESWHNAHAGRYHLLSLTERAVSQAQLPAIRCIDASKLIVNDGLTPTLIAAIAERIKRGEQSLLFLNRRGYSPVLMCTACGWLSACPHCAGKLVLHLSDRRLRCHHCGHQQRVPHACPSCGNPDLQPVGSGTQRVEEALAEHFPEARILRVDRDSTRNKGSWAAMRQQIQDDAVDILIGTQMLAKGHDFPNLTLVGVLNPDNALYSCDFRAPERLYAQLAQVAGRAGRADKPGEVLIQTAFPDHPLFRALQAHDFAGWAESQLAERKMAGFPPYVYQTMLRAEARDATLVFDFLNRARAAALALQAEVEVYGVVPAALARRAEHTRAQLLIQSSTRAAMQSFLQDWHPQLEALAAPKLRWSLDIDPLEF